MQQIDNSNDEYLGYRKSKLAELVQVVFKAGKMNNQEYKRKLVAIKKMESFEVENDIILFKALANNRDAKPMP